MATDSTHTQGELLLVDASQEIFPDEVYICIKPAEGEPITTPICNVIAGSLNPQGKANAARLVECWNEHDQLKEDNKILRDLCKKMHVELWETISDLRGLNAQGRLNRFGVKRLNDCTDLYEKANNFLSPSNQENNEK